ncbi:MAG: hypothetical protein K2P51_03170 [Rhabdochlamydiaceae bacterium]|nr:hypothetical protein [Rhabdochlamydiaceae bacterium]
MVLATAILLVSSQILSTPVMQAAELTTEEIAFAARLEDSHRKFFVENMTPFERKLVMEDAKMSLSDRPGDDAIAQCRISKEKKMDEIQ